MRDRPFLTSGIRALRFLALASGIRARQGQQDRDLSVLFYGKWDLLTKWCGMKGPYCSPSMLTATIVNDESHSCDWFAI